MAIGKHHTRYDNATDTWLTPPEMIEELGPFDTDPCCPENMPWRTATKMITPAECGLLTPWTGRVWMNPPYLWNEVFTDKFIQHKNGIMLSFARTETVWFQKLKDAHAFLFLKGRLTFHKLDGTAGKGFDLVIFLKDEPDQYGNHGFVAESVPKDSATKGTILGQAKIAGQKPQSPQPTQAQQAINEARANNAPVVAAYGPDLGDPLPF